MRQTNPNDQYSFIEILEELKKLRIPMNSFRKVTFGLLRYNYDYRKMSKKEKAMKENELLDIEYDHIIRMQKCNQLPSFNKLDVDVN